MSGFVVFIKECNLNSLIFKPFKNMPFKNMQECVVNIWLLLKYIKNTFFDKITLGENASYMNNPGGVQGRANNPGVQQNGQGGAINPGPVRGFTYDPVLDKYIIYDPLNKASQGFHSKVSHQPYANNLANALEHNFKNQGNLTVIGTMFEYRSVPVKHWKQFCDTLPHKRQTHYNTIARRAALRRLP